MSWNAGLVPSCDTCERRSITSRTPSETHLQVQLELVHDTIQNARRYWVRLLEQGRQDLDKVPQEVLAHIGADDIRHGVGFMPAKRYVHEHEHEHEHSPDNIRKPLKEARHDVIPSRNITRQDHRLDRRETVEKVDILGVVRNVGDPL
jgi:hypothetical protein